MARGLNDLIATTFGTRCEALERRTLLNVDGFNHQFIDVCAIVMFCISNRRLEHFFNNARSLLLRKVEYV